VTSVRKANKGSILCLCGCSLVLFCCCLLIDH
jgi:hypothetical protein